MVRGKGTTLIEYFEVFLTVVVFQLTQWHHFYGVWYLLLTWPRSVNLVRYPYPGELYNPSKSSLDQVRVVIDSCSTAKYWKWIWSLIVAWNSSLKESRNQIENHLKRCLFASSAHKNRICTLSEFQISSFSVQIATYLILSSLTSSLSRLATSFQSQPQILQ